MKNAFFSLAALTISLVANAQAPVTLTKSNITGQAPGPFNYYYNASASAKFSASPSTGANQTWDYSTLTGFNLVKHNLIPASSFSSTAVVDTTAFEEFVIPGRIVYTQAVTDIDAIGYYSAGRILQKQSYTLADLTGNPKDSANWPAQTYYSRDNVIPFPTTMGSAWSQTSVYPLNFLLTATPFGLNKAPNTIVKHKYIKDTVVGWGTLTIPAGSKSSIPYNVLLCRRLSFDVDSFYLNGSAAPLPILQGFKVKQNDTVFVEYSEYFISAGDGTKLLSINYGTDSTYTTASTATYAADNVQSGIKLNGVDPEIFNIYPNPANAGMIHLNLLKTSAKAWDLSIINPLGQNIKKMILNGSGNLNVPIDMTGFHPGLYFIQITDEKGNSILSARQNIAR